MRVRSSGRATKNMKEKCPLLSLSFCAQQRPVGRIVKMFIVSLFFVNVRPARINRLLSMRTAIAFRARAFVGFDAIYWAAIAFAVKDEESSFGRRKTGELYNI